jgi:hypothetical protein
MEPHGHHHGSHEHEHEHTRKPIDLSYRVVIRTTLWVIAGAVLVGLIVWWVRT